MQVVDTILFFTSFVLFGILLYDGFKTLKTKKRNHTFLDSYLFKYLVSIFFIVCTSIIVVIVFAKPPNFSNEFKRIEFGEVHHDYRFVHSGYKSLIEKDKVNIDYNFHYTESLKFLGLYNQSEYPSFDFVRKSKYNRELKSHFNELILNGNESERDQGYMFLALNEINLQGDLKVAELDLLEVKNKSIKYYDYVYGLYLAVNQNEQINQDSEKYLWSSINKNEAVRESTILLSVYYFYLHDLNQVESLLNDEKTFQFVPSYVKRITYLSKGRYLDYVSYLISSRLFNVYWLGLIFAFVISLVWLMYLRQVDVFEPEKWYHILIVFMLSCLTILLVFPYNDYITYFIGYEGGGNSALEFIREFIKIGLIEEIVKIIPVLLILKFTKAINEPFDYILYVAVSALGFAFIENFGYIREDSLYNINARMLYSAVGHMLFSSIVGYSMMLGKYYYKFKGKSFVLFGVGLLLAALVHTFYDFWLIDSWARHFPQMTTILMLVGIHAWFVMKNNALNLSNFYLSSVNIENDKVRFNLIISLVSVFMGSFIVNSFIYGAEQGYNLLKSDYFNYAFFILYLAFSFSRYEHIRGYLKSFQIPYNILIPQLLKAPLKSQDEVSFYSVKLKGRNEKRTYKIDEFTPFKGIVREEVLVDGRPDYFVVDINKDFGLDQYKSWQLVVQSNNKKRVFNKNGKTLINALVVLPHIELNSTTLTKSDFRFIGLMVMVVEDKKDDT